jgi:parvulin-like peptidyl-prolyl isomerase
MEPTVAPTPFDEEGYAQALRDLLRNSGMGRSEFNSIVEAQLLERRLRDQFETEIDTSVPQMRLQRVRLGNQEDADRVRAEALTGTDFVLLASQNSTDTNERNNGGELGWSVVDSLSEQVRDAVGSLEPGQISPVVQTDRYFEVYKVVEVDPNREMDAAQLVPVLDEKMDEWYAQQRPNLRIERDLSSDEEDWIRDGVVSDLQEALEDIESTGG